MKRSEPGAVVARRNARALLSRPMEIEKLIARSAPSHTLACASVLLLALAPACFASSTSDPEGLRNRALELVNQARREAGLHALELAEKANHAARTHATDMLRRDYYSHTSPEGDTVQDRYIAAGGSKWRLTAENIARCGACTSQPDLDAVDRLHRGWMESSGHRQNILRRGLRQFGFSFVSDLERGQYAVQTFAGPGVPRGDEDAAEVAPPEQTAIVISHVNEARGANDLPQLESGGVLIDLAKSILPAPVREGFEIDRDMNLYELLPRDQRGAWRSISVMVAACGGCGTEPTGADARFFAEQWLNDPRHRQNFMRSRLTHLGVVVAASGRGKKIGVAILGDKF